MGFAKAAGPAKTTQRGRTAEPINPDLLKTLDETAKDAVKDKDHRGYVDLDGATVKELTHYKNDVTKWNKARPDVEVRFVTPESAPKDEAGKPLAAQARITVTV